MASATACGYCGYPGGGMGYTAVMADLAMADTGATASASRSSGSSTGYPFFGGFGYGYPFFGGFLRIRFPFFGLI